MAIIKASYTVERGQAYAGQLADTSSYNVDGACVAEGAIMVGKAVAVKDVDPVEGHKIVVQLKDNTLPLLGVTLMSHAYSPEGVYEPETAVNVVTNGRIWMLATKATAAADVKYDTKVKLNADGIAASAGTIETNWRYTGQILPAGADFNIVEVQVLQSAGYAAAASGN